MVGGGGRGQVQPQPQADEMSPRPVCSTGNRGMVLPMFPFSAPPEKVGNK